MIFLFIGSLILLHGSLAACFYQRGKETAAVFNLSCISLQVYLLYMKF